MANDPGALIALSAEIITAYVTKNSIGTDQVAGAIASVHSALSQLGSAPITPDGGTAPAAPAVAVRASVKHDHLVCLEDGKKLKILKRHLEAEHGLTPAAYRAKWKLPGDYPMVAPEYAARRRQLAIDVGLVGGRQSSNVEQRDKSKQRR